MAPISEPHKQRAASVGAEEKHPCKPEEEKQVDSPVHPVPQLQGPFDESILEAVQGMDKEWMVDLDAQTRRGPTGECRLRAAMWPSMASKAQ